MDRQRRNTCIGGYPVRISAVPWIILTKAFRGSQFLPENSRTLLPRCQNCSYDYTQCDTATYRLRYSQPYNRHIIKECQYKSPVTNPTTRKLWKAVHNDTVLLLLTGERLLLLLLFIITLRCVLSTVPHSFNIMWWRWGKPYSHNCCFTHGPRAPVCRLFPHHRFLQDCLLFFAQWEAQCRSDIRTVTLLYCLRFRERKARQLCTYRQKVFLECNLLKILCKCNSDFLIPLLVTWSVTIFPILNYFYVTISSCFAVLIQ